MKFIFILCTAMLLKVINLKYLLHCLVWFSSSKLSYDLVVASSSSHTGNCAYEEKRISLHFPFIFLCEQLHSKVPALSCCSSVTSLHFHVFVKDSWFKIVNQDTRSQKYISSLFKPSRVPETIISSSNPIHEMVTTL